MDDFEEDPRKFLHDVFEKLDFSCLEAARKDLVRIKNDRFSIKLCVPGLLQANNKNVEALMNYLIDFPVLKKNGYEAILLTERLRLKKIEEVLARITPGEQPYLILAKNGLENCTLLIPTAKNNDSKDF